MSPSERLVKGAHDLGLKLYEWPGPTPKAPVLLLVHGFGHDSHVWEPLVPDLTQRYRVAALDLRGHGGSDRDPGFRYHHITFGQDLARVVPELGAAPLTLVAHSTGGHAAIGYTARHPQRIARLVLPDAGPQLAAKGGGVRTGSEGGDGSFESHAQYAARLRRFYPLAQGDLLDRLAKAWLRERADGRFEPTLDPALLRPNVRGEAQPRGRAARRNWNREAWARQGEKALAEDLRKLHCPTLVVRGARSPLFSARTQARMVDELLADGHAAVVERAGHAMMIDNPDGLRDALFPYLLA